MSKTIQVDVKSLATSLRPDCVDHYACRVFLTLYPADALRLVRELVEKMDAVGVEQVMELAHNRLIGENW